MPRPGPRPYECVRRAWHSDRHQPVRGSLIREIFRVANEIHSPATRKNKEWQEKLPTVVFKAEEIMYSKANSEAEYVDLKTLWDRANDAIDTIIRRDDTTTTTTTTESGDLLLLQPCIEAALTLGCIPRKASRSQRHSNSRCYLSSSMQEASSLKIPDDNNNRSPRCPGAGLLGPPPPLPAHLGNLQNSSTRFVSWISNCGGHLSEAGSITPVPPNEHKDSLLISRPDVHVGIPSEDFPLSRLDRSLSLAHETRMWASMGRVYPLYYGANLHNVESCSSFGDPLGSGCNEVTAGSVPYVSSVREIDMQNFFDASNETSNLGGDRSGNPPNKECDLSLGLALPSTTCLGAEDDAWAREVEDVGSSSSWDGSKFRELSPSQTRVAQFKCSFPSPPRKHMGSHFIPPVEVPVVDEALESCSSKRSLEEEAGGALLYHVAASHRKRKAPLDDSADYGHIRCEQTLPVQQQFYSRIVKPDL